MVLYAAGDKSQMLVGVSRITRAQAHTQTCNIPEHHIFVCMPVPLYFSHCGKKKTGTILERFLCSSNVIHLSLNFSVRGFGIVHSICNAHRLITLSHSLI